MTRAADGRWRRFAALGAVGLTLLAGGSLAAAVTVTSPAATAAPAAAAEPAEPAAPSSPPRPRRFRIGVEVKANFRHSDDYRFQLHYPNLYGAATNQETVDPGSHFEVSNVALLMDYQPSDLFAAHLRFNGINLYYRNPTSSDHPYDLAELWLRFGRETGTAIVPRQPGAYIKLGKFPRPERQEDRHLASYGLAGTAFNLFEDAGLELGADLGRHVFAKASVTQGNPLFIRDPNALAGDTPDLLAGYSDARLNSGVVILYDTHVERLDFAHPEYSAALGWRLGDAAAGSGLELMAWGRRRTLAAAFDLPGSPLPADLAVLFGPSGAPILAMLGNGKQELGANLWVYQASGLSLFAQFVDQRVSGLERTGIETEAAWRIDLPLAAAAGGHQLFTYLAPAVRFSRLHNLFVNLRPTPEPSLAWDWEKYDGGIRLGLWKDIDLTLEYSYNRIFINPQRIDHENEALATLRIRVW
jgi:hypothetical protein